MAKKSTAASKSSAGGKRAVTSRKKVFGKTVEVYSPSALPNVTKAITARTVFGDPMRIEVDGAYCLAGLISAVGRGIDTGGTQLTEVKGWVYEQNPSPIPPNPDANAKTAQLAGAGFFTFNCPGRLLPVRSEPGTAVHNGNYLVLWYKFVGDANYSTYGPLQLSCQEGATTESGCANP